MKLIDLDEIEYFTLVDKDGKPRFRVEIGDGLPIVKAIPIEFIEKWKSGKTSIEQVVADKIMMDYKYKDYWEKENETTGKN